MKAFIACLLFWVLFGISALAPFAQQDQSYQKLVQEVEALETQVAALQIQLQTVENIDKMKLLAELADANVKLVNAEFGKFERELRDSNSDWLIKWIVIFLTFLALIGGFLWSQYKSKTDKLIADEVEKSLKGFKAAMAQVNMLKDQVRALQKEHTSEVIENFIDHPPWR